MLRPILVGLALLVFGTANAADLSRRPQAAGPVLFAPTNPIGVASEIPRSPLTDFIVDAQLRFDTRAEAQARCPRDAVVWVALFSNFYRLDGRRSGDPDETGAYMCQADASSEGDRPLRSPHVRKRQ